MTFSKYVGRGLVIAKMVDPIHFVGAFVLGCIEFQQIVTNVEIYNQNIWIIMRQRDRETGKLKLTQERNLAYIRTN